MIGEREERSQEAGSGGRRAKAQECVSLWACAGAGRKWILSCKLQKECYEPTPRFSLLGSVSDVHRPKDSESAALKANTGSHLSQQGDRDELV